MRTLRRSFVYVLGLLVLMTAHSTAQWSKGHAIQLSHLINANSTIYGIAYNGFTFGMSLYRSNDKGKSWTDIGSALPPIEVLQSVAVNGTTLFVAGGSSSVFRSTDNGASWTAAYNGLAAAYVYSLVVVDGSLLAGTNKGIYRSTDNGNNWSNVSPYPCSSFSVNDSTVYTIVTGGCLRSTDSGKTWTLFLASELYETQSICRCGSTLVTARSSGVLRSVDNGMTWTWMNGPPAFYMAFAAMGTDLFAATPNKIYRSTEKSNTLISMADIGRMGLLRELLVVDTTLIASTNGGVFQAANNFANWQTDTASLYGSNVTALAVRNNTLFAGINNTLYDTTGGGVFYSSDNGATWKGCNIGWAVFGVNVLTVSGTEILAGTPMGVFHSADDGRSWAALGTGFSSYAVKALVLHDGDVYAGTTRGVYVLGSQDVAWRSANRGLTSSDIRALVFNGDTLYAGTVAGVYRSIDHGANWLTINTNLLDLSVTALTVCDGDLFAGTLQRGVFQLTEGGTKWVAMNDGLWRQDIGSLASNGLQLYAGMRGSGFFLSTNKGKTWYQVNTGVNNNSFSVYAFAIVGNELAMGTSSYGVLHKPLSEISTAVADRPTSLQPEHFTLDQNYPNPFNPSTTISFSLPERSHVSLKIFDVMGRDVATIVSETLPAGTYARAWNALGCPSGVYFYRLQAGAFAETKRLIVVK